MKFEITREQLDKITAVIATTPTSVGMAAVDAIREVLRHPIPEPTDKTTSDATAS